MNRGAGGSYHCAMAEVRVSAWPLAVAGSLLVHVTMLTGLYLAPKSDGAQAALARPGLNGPTVESEPLYLIPDELPPDIAAKLEAEKAAEAVKARVQQPPKDLLPSPLPPPPPPPELAQKPKPTEPVPVPLGAVDGPKIQTKAWLKNDAEGELQAPKSIVVQPPKDLNAQPTPQGLPGQGGADGKQTASKSEEQATAGAQEAAKQGEAAKDTPARPSAAEAANPAMASADPRVHEADKPSTMVDAGKEKAAPKASDTALAAPTLENDGPKSPTTQEVKAGNSGGEPVKPRKAETGSTSSTTHEVFELVGPPLPDNFVPPKGGTAGVPTAAPAVRTAHGGGAPGAPGTPQATPTVPSDRDSDPANVKVSGIFRNGKVEVGEGLDITTYRPNFALSTRALRQPRSPTLEIVFGKDGRARSVRVLRSSGFPAEVDDPVVTALYNWRAKGRVLDELPPVADSSVSLEITILLE